MSALHDAAMAYVAAHLSVIPIFNLRAKQPNVKWAIYQEHCPPPADLDRWFGSNPALAIVCGTVSGSLTVLDFDAKRRLLYDEWHDVMESTHPGLVDSLPLVTTQSGGRHLYFIAPIIEGNQKLATTPPLKEVDARTGEIQQLIYAYIETRGQGGYVLAPPTPGYVLVRGDLTAIPHISADDYTALLSTARLFDENQTEQPDPDWPEPDQHRSAASDDEEKPGKLYDRKASVADVVAILVKHGWRVAHTSRAGIPYLTRPGKSTHEGISGNVKIIGGVPVFYNFSTSVSEFSVKGYSPFQVLGLLECGGDWAAAAKRAYELAVPAPIPFTISAARAKYGYADAGTDPELVEQPSPVVDRPVFKLWTDDELIALPPPEMLIKDMLPARGMSILYAAAGVGKSFLAIDWAYRVALGMEWFGLPCTQGQVLYIAAEGQGGLGKRLTAWRMTHNNGAGTAALRFITHPVYPTRAETFNTLQASIEAVGVAQPVLIIIDTLARINDGDENSTQDMSALINAIDAIRLQWGCAVLLIHHRGHTEGRIRGSSTLLGAADAVLAVEKDMDTGVLTLSSNKMKDGADFDPWKLMLKVIPVGETTSCVLTLAAGQPRKLTEHMAAVLAVLVRAPLDGMRFFEIQAASELPKSTLNRTLKELVFHRLITVLSSSKNPGTGYQISTLGGTAHSCGTYHPSSTPSPLVVPPSSKQFQGSLEHGSRSSSTVPPPLYRGELELRNYGPEKSTIWDEWGDE